MTYRIQQGDLTIVRGHIRSSSFSFTSATVRVRRDTGPNAPAECVDLSDGTEFLNLTQVGGRLDATAQPDTVSGRCAGPLPQDVVNLSLPVRRVGKGHRTLDLGGTVPFSAGPFSGRLISSLTLRPTGRGSSSSSGSGSSGSFTGHFFHRSSRHVSTTKHSLVELVELKYGLAVEPSSLDFAFRGDPGPFCGALDDCGARGDLSLTAPGQRTSLLLTAYRRVGSRRSPRQVRHDFYTQPWSFALGAFASLTATVQESFTWSGGLTCRDTVAHAPEAGLPPLAIFGTGGSGAPPSARRRLTLVLQASGSDALRTHCPGPASSDLVGQDQVLARGAFSFRHLRGRQETLDLTRPGRFAGEGYGGRRVGALRLRLSLLSVKANTRGRP